MALEGAGEVIEQLQPAVGEDGAAIAILADRMAVMARQDDVRAAQALAKSDRTALAEALIADLGDFVDQVDSKSIARHVPKASRARIPAE